MTISTEDFYCIPKLCLETAGGFMVILWQHIAAKLPLILTCSGFLATHGNFHLKNAKNAAVSKPLGRKNTDFEQASKSDD